MNKKQFILFGIILSFIHIIITLFFLIIVSSAGSTKFDNPEYKLPLLIKIISFVINVLMFPAAFLWKFFPSSINVLEWVFFILNSLLWGFIITILIAMTVKATCYLKHLKGKNNFE